MSLKRSSASGRGPTSGSSDSGTKLNREGLFEELKRLAGTGQVFTPIDLSLSIGASEPVVSRALLGLAVEGVLEKVETGRYRATGIADLDLADFLKAYTHASKVDGSRQKDLSEIDRLKKNNDIMRGRLMQAQAEREHYLAVLKQHGIDPGPLPATVAIALPAAEQSTGGTGAS